MKNGPPDKSNGRVRGQTLRLCCGEPFRIFFPVGSALAVVGVSLWPLFYFGAAIPYPAIAHARLMIEGFMASFIFGFLGTAGPRITSTPPFSVLEVGTLFTLSLLSAGMHIGGADRLGDTCFLLCLLFFARTILVRFQKRKDCPPPNFVLVALGLLSGIGGAALVAYSAGAQYSRSYQFGSALLNEVFVLLPILGVAPFFIGRLLDLPRPELPESRNPPPGWFSQAAFAALTGLAIIGSFVIDIFHLPEAGGWLRIFAIIVYLGRQLPFRGRTFLADYLRLGILFIATGLTIAAIFPIYRVGWLHIIFIGGFNLIVFTVAIRVAFGHSGNLQQLRRPLPFFCHQQSSSIFGDDFPLHGRPGAACSCRPPGSGGVLLAPGGIDLGRQCPPESHHHRTRGELNGNRQAGYISPK